MDNCFDKRYRLLKTEEFSSVFVLKKQRSRQFIQVWCLKNNAYGYPRLGLVVSKKVAKRANQRNYMKRFIREWFRQHKHQLPPNDFIVRVRFNFNKENALLVQDELLQLMR